MQDTCACGRFVYFRSVTVLRYNGCLCATVISVDSVLASTHASIVHSHAKWQMMTAVLRVRLPTNNIVLLLYPTGPACSGSVSLVPHFKVLHFYVVTFGPAFSGPAFSGADIWSCIFRSCFFKCFIFFGPPFSGPAFSVDPIHPVTSMRVDGEGSGG